MGMIGRRVRNIGLLLVVYAAGCEAPVGTAGLRPTGIFGIGLGAIELTDTGGTSATLAERLAGGPGIVVMLDRESCLGCGDYATELKIVGRKWPGLSQLLVVEGPIDQELERFFRLRQLTPLRDSNGTLLARLGLRRPPAVVVVDPAGGVLLLDGRRGPGSKGFPISRVLAELAAALSADGEESVSGAGRKGPSEREEEAIVSGIPRAP